MKFIVHFSFLLSFCWLSAQNKNVDFTKIAATLEPNLQERSLNGQVTYTYVLNARIDSIFIDAKNMQVTEFKLDGRKKPFSND